LVASAIKQSQEANLLPLITHYKGHYLVVLLISIFPHRFFGFIDQAMLQNLEVFGTNNQGLQVIKALFKYRTPEQLLPLMEAISGSAKFLVGHEFGNYVVQQMISKLTDPSSLAKDREETNFPPPGGMAGGMGALRPEVKQSLLDRMLSHWLGSFRQLSLAKYSSNVVEQCLKQTVSKKWIAAIVKDFLAPPVSDLMELIHHR